MSDAQKLIGSRAKHSKGSDFSSLGLNKKLEKITENVDDEKQFEADYAEEKDGVVPGAIIVESEKSE